MNAVRTAVNQLPRSRSRPEHLFSKSTPELIETSSSRDAKQLKKNVHFALDESDGVKVDIYEYKPLNNDSCFSTEHQREFSIHAKLEGRRFYRLNRKTVVKLEEQYRDSSEFCRAADAHELDFFRQWAASEARGLERKISKQQVFYTERSHAIETVLHQQDLLMLQQPSHTTTTNAEVLRECSLQLSHRSRVFAYHMAVGDEAVARSYTA